MTWYVNLMKNGAHLADVQPFDAVYAAIQAANSALRSGTADDVTVGRTTPSTTNSAPYGLRAKSSALLGCFKAKSSRRTREPLVRRRRRDGHRETHAAKLMPAK